jgi:hypothetical protein
MVRAPVAMPPVRAAATSAQYGGQGVAQPMHSVAERTRDDHGSQAARRSLDLCQPVLA